jgi:rubrerythrin
MNVFDHAIKLEQDGKTFFERLAADAKSAELKNIFALLAEAEEGHLAAMEAMKAGADPATAESKALDKACTIKNDFTKLLEQRETAAELRGDPDGYKHAIKALEEEIRFYEVMAKNETSEETRKLVLQIVEEEKRHLSIIENIYDFLESPQTYLASGEFSNLSKF